MKRIPWGMEEVVGGWEEGVTRARRKGEWRRRGGTRTGVRAGGKGKRG
jgi:hypothetical protein